MMELSRLSTARLISIVSGNKFRELSIDTQDQIWLIFFRRLQNIDIRLLEKLVIENINFRQWAYHFRELMLGVLDMKRHWELSDGDELIIRKIEICLLGEGLDYIRDIERSFHQLKISKEWIFAIDIGRVSEEFRVLFWQEVVPWIDLNVGDIICMRHIDFPTIHNNPHNRSTRELFISGFKRMQEHIQSLTEVQRPRFIISCSHLAQWSADRYPSLFWYFPLPQHISTCTRVHHYLTAGYYDYDNMYSLFQGTSDPRSQAEIASIEAYAWISRKYKDGTLPPIWLAIAKVEDFLNYDFG